MVINAQKQAKYISVTIGLITLLYIIRLNILFLQNDASESPDLLTTRIYVEIAIVTILAVLISKTRKLIENVDERTFAITIRLVRMPLMIKTYQKENVKTIGIEQDSKRYYCLMIQFQDNHGLLIARHPNLRPVEEELSILKQELGI